MPASNRLASLLLHLQPSSTSASVPLGKEGPLKGVRVLDLSAVVAGPLCGGLLCEQGAEVIKVEMTNGTGDTGRFFGDRHNGVGALFHMCNRGKRAICVNAKEQEGIDLLLRLAEKVTICLLQAQHSHYFSVFSQCDVILQNFRPGVVDKMGIGYEQICAVNPGTRLNADPVVSKHLHCSSYF